MSLGWLLNTQLFVVQTVVVADVTRISLDPTIVQRWLNMAYAFGVEVVSVANELNTPKEAAWLLGLFDSFSEFLGE